MQELLLGKKFEMKINQVFCFKSDQINKYEIGTIISELICPIIFLVKTKDSFLKVISYEYDGKIEKEINLRFREVLRIFKEYFD